MARSFLPSAAVAVVLPLLLLFVHDGRCQPGPDVLDRAPPPIAEVLEGAPPLPAVDQAVNAEIERVAGRLTDEMQRKYGFCMADVYVP